MRRLLDHPTFIQIQGYVMVNRWERSLLDSIASEMIFALSSRGHSPLLGPLVPGQHCCEKATELSFQKVFSCPLFCAWYIMFLCILFFSIF